MGKKIFAYLVFVTLLFAMVFAVGQSPAVAEKPEDVHFYLTILHNNDGESVLLGDGDFGGAARFKALVDDLKRHSRLHLSAVTQ